MDTVDTIHRIDWRNLIHWIMLLDQMAPLDHRL